jgi:hypothetical protein
MDLWLVFLFVVAGGVIGATIVAIFLSLLISRRR